MAHPIVVPRLGWTMEEGTFVQWLKNDGDSVRVGDLLFILEGEKAAQEVEAVDAGILHIPPDAPKPGQVIPVGALLGYLVAPGEALPRQAAGAAAPAAASVAHVEMVAAAPAKQVSREAPGISPRARRIAREIGIDYRQLKGSGRGGRIRECDVLAAAPAPPPAAAITPNRKVIAQRMLAGAHETAPVTLTARTDVTNLVNLRNQFKTVGGAVVPTLSDFLLKLTALALKEHPALNARWTDAAIEVVPARHIGLAVDTDAGLLVPVLRDVDSLGLRQIAAQTRELIELARARRLTAEQMQGGTFTITNLGMYGIDAFTPIINLPQCAILGIGAVRKEAVVVEDRIVPRDQMTLSLTFDHRVIDGAPAARFLDTLRKHIEQPGAWLVS